jgi:hypothetical protein
MPAIHTNFLGRRPRCVHITFPTALRIVIIRRWGRSSRDASLDDRQGWSLGRHSRFFDCDNSWFFGWDVLGDNCLFSLLLFLLGLLLHSQSLGLFLLPQFLGLVSFKFLELGHLALPQRVYTKD